MSVFHYKAKNKEGKLEKGSITGATKLEVQATLKDRGLVLLAVKEEKQRKLFTSKKIPINEKVSLCRYLGLIIKSGMSFTEGLNLLANGTSNKTVQAVIDDVASQTRQGKSLYASFKVYEEQFGQAFMAVIKSGETSGSLSESFEYLANQFQQEKEIKGKVMSALLYPFIIIGLMIAVGLVLFTFVLPQLAVVFSKMNIKLPFMTKLMFDTSLAFKDNMVIVFAAVFLFIGGVIVALRSKTGKKIFKAILLKTPIVKRLIQDYNLVRFTQSLASLLKSGVPVTEAMDLSVKTLSFVKTEKMSVDFSSKISRGVSLSQVFQEAKIFPPLMVQLITIGEKTGNLETMLAELSLFYKDEVETSLKNFVTALEPTLMIFVGLGVGAMVISVISPIYSLIGQLQAGL